MCSGCCSPGFAGTLKLNSRRVYSPLLKHAWLSYVQGQHLVHALELLALICTNYRDPMIPEYQMPSAGRVLLQACTRRNPPIKCCPRGSAGQRPTAGAAALSNAPACIYRIRRPSWCCGMNRSSRIQNLIYLVDLHFNPTMLLKTETIYLWFIAF
jgi:hypothetical protein